jgi:transposase
MSGFRQPEVPREQQILWPERLDNAVPVDHPVRHVDFLLRSAAFAALFREWELEYVLLEGKPPYHPRDLAGLYIYGMLNRIRSSRQLEAACHNRIDVRWLMSSQHPDHSTIAEFVSRHGKHLRRLKREVLQVGLRAGLVTLGHVAVDGTKIEADAGRGSVQGEAGIAEGLAKLDEQIAAWEAEWSANESREQGCFGDEVPWVGQAAAPLAQQLARAKRQQDQLRRALANIVRRQEEAEQAGSKPPKAIASTTDADSRVMRDKEGRRKANYNAQLAVDTTCGMIAGDAVNDQAEDSGQLTPQLKEVEANCDRLPAEASGDSNYNTGPELAKLESMGVVGYLPGAHQASDIREPRPAGSAAASALAAIPAGQPLSEEQALALPRDSQGYLDRSAFQYDAERDRYCCPAGQTLRYIRNSQKQSRSGPVKRRQYGGAFCAGCPLAEACCRNPAKGRVINRDQYEEHRERMRARMSSGEGRNRYRLRRQTVEPRIGHIKHGLGIRRFLRRGLALVSTEWGLICTAVNVGVLLRNWEAVQAVL